MAQCGKCGGSGLVDVIEHGVETDANGNQKPVQRQSTQQCGMCGGTGEA
jgi:hypothetical protein